MRRAELGAFSFWIDGGFSRAYVSINIDDANSLKRVTFVNSALPVFLKAMQLMVEVHREYGDDQDSMFLKLLAQDGRTRSSRHLLREESALGDGAVRGHVHSAHGRVYYRRCGFLMVDLFMRVVGPEQPPTG